MSSPNASLHAFTPRVVDIDYISEPSGPIVFLEPAGSGSGIYNCASTYPFDPRNLSLYDEVLPTM